MRERKRSGFPRHPRCGERGIPLVDRAAEITAGETVAFRGYVCRKCSEETGRRWAFWTAERIFCDDAPTPYLRSKMAEDFEETEAPAVAGGRT